MAVEKPVAHKMIQNKNSGSYRASKQPVTLIAIWQHKLQQSLLSKFDFVITLLILGVVLINYKPFLVWNETRNDIKHFAVLSDPILPYLKAYDLSIPLFMTVYGSLVLGAMYAIHKPNLLLQFWQCMSLVVIVRMIGLYLTPLEAPENTIPLIDPLAPSSGSKPLVRDLFFSGHTATTFMVYFAVHTEHRRWKMLFLMISVLTAVMVIIQKTHYVIDVFSAPFFVYTCHRMVKKMRTKLGIAYQLDRKLE